MIKLASDENFDGDYMPKGQAIEQLFLALHCLAPEDCKDQVHYFPI